MNYLCDVLSSLLFCYSPPQSTTTLQDALFRNNDWKCSLQEPEQEVPRVRRRYTSSPRPTPAVLVFSPAVTPISIFLSYGRASFFKHALSLKEESLPDQLNYSSRFAPLSLSPCAMSVFLSWVLALYSSKQDGWGDLGKE